ncbi:MAG TPA: hypothetical protein VKB57_23535 [Acidimicrobiales bacterium]|nr:hypothetical protein [Acidimicrobiales bacterium]
MHPIERLRAVARAREVDQAVLAREAASVLGAFAGDPLGLVTACRRLLDRHPTAATLWWTFARLLDTADVRAEAQAVRRDLDDAPAVSALALDLPDRVVVALVPDVAGGSELAMDLLAERDDMVIAHDPGALHVERDEPRILLVEAGAAGPDRFLAPAGAEDEIEAARDAGVAVWLVVDVGRRLPKPLFEALVRRAPAGCEQLAPALAERVVEPRRVACPVPPELLRPPAPGDPGAR